MKRCQQLLSSLLILCLAVGGWIGVSPALHRMVEHGGHGPAHVHGKFREGHEDARAHPHSHSHEDVQVRSDWVRPFAEKHRSPTVFGLELTKLYRAVGEWIARSFPPAPGQPSRSGDDDGHGHAHHSFVQMLLSGAVESCSDLLPAVCAPLQGAFSSESCPASHVASEFDAQTASRAPPVLI